jgi:hypothetical protein
MTKKIAPLLRRIANWLDRHDRKRSPILMDGRSIKIIR